MGLLFVKGPASPGQGYHQDSFHIITEPDTLMGAWVALDRADEENGCRWVTSGSQHEPVYPDIDESKGHGGDFHVADIHAVSGADDPDESLNDLAQIAAKYPGRERPAVLDPGDAVSSAAMSFIALTRTAAARAREGPSSATTATPAPTCRGRPSTGRICLRAAAPTCRTAGRGSYASAPSSRRIRRRIASDDAYVESIP